MGITQVTVTVRNPANPETGYSWWIPGLSIA